MDTEKEEQVQDLIRDGRHPGDEGPYYHHTFWEAYKGSMAGKIGGLIIGAVIGAAAGGVAALLFACFTSLSVISPFLIVGGFAAAGMLYGADEFGQIGLVSGAIAAAHRDSEARMRAIEKSQFNELKSEIHELKQIAKGESVDTSARTAATNNVTAIEKDLSEYRTTHLREDIPLPKPKNFIFWKIALAGLILGAGIGALIPLTSVGAGILADLGLQGGQYLASTVAFSAIGASFGVNRDLFRAMFDKTDLWFKGIFNFSKSGVQANSVERKLDSEDLAKPIHSGTSVKTLIYPDTKMEDAIVSDTFHRDKVMASAQKALQEMDHTCARSH